MYRIESEQDGGSGPKGPNFKLVVVLFAVGILVILGIAIFVVRGMRHDIHGPASLQRTGSSSTVRLC